MTPIRRTHSSSIVTYRPLLSGSQGEARLDAEKYSMREMLLDWLDRRCGHVNLPFQV
jgi:hypothetical protein